VALPGWLSTLPKSARLFYPIALRGVREGLSANSILKVYTAARPGLRRQVGLDIIRRVKGVEKAASVFKHLKLTAHPNVGRIPVALTGTLRDFSYRVSYEAFTDEGERTKSFVTVSTNDLMSRQEAEDVALGYLEEMPKSYGVESVASVQLEDIRKSPSLG